MHTWGKLPINKYLQSDHVLHQDDFQRGEHEDSGAMHAKIFFFQKNNQAMVEVKDFEE